MGTNVVILLLSTTLFTSLFEISVACNGYQIRVNHAQNCNPNSVIKLERFNLTLDKDCNIIPSGCIVITKPFEKADVHYTMNKPPLPAIQGDTELCESMDSNNDRTITDILTKLQLPTKCPVHPRKSCGTASTKINISKYKNRLAIFAGTLNLKSEVTHDTGVTCTDINLTLERHQQG